MSKIDFSKKTKLEINKKSSSDEESLNILNKKSNSFRNKSFRFRSIDLERLIRVLNKTNDSSKSTIFKETDIIRALLALGDEITGEKIITYVRKSI